MNKIWINKRLREVFKTASGGTPLKIHKEYYENGKIPWLMSGEVNKREIYNSTNFITELGYNNSSAKAFPINTVLVAMYGATAGQVGLLKFEACTNQAVCGIYPNKEFVPEFIYYYFKNIFLDLVSQATGNAQPNISQKKIKNLLIPIPPLDEQQNIVEILDKAFTVIDKAIENTEQNLKNAKDLFQSKLDEVFSRKGEGWKEKKIGNILKLEYGKPLPKEKRSHNGLYPVYGANGVLARSDEFYLDELSIIVGRKGSAGEVNYTESRFWPLDVTYYVTYGNKIMDLDYIYYLLKSLNIPKLAKGIKPGINRNDVYKIKKMIPSLSEQKIIVNSLKNIFKEIDELNIIQNKQLNLLQSLKKSMLQKAFSGELTN